MKKIKRAVGAGLLAGMGLTMLAAAPAGADDDPIGQVAAAGGGGSGFLSGNAIAAPIALDLDLACNLNGLGVLGLGAGVSACG